ncbi:MAG: hypothetical protein ACJA0Q_000408 [Saprospiraceae bacterium]|jgi:uncharacterized protein (TIGR02118 family)
MKKGMVKVSVMYPGGEGKKFNLDYYCNTHLAMVGGLLGDALQGANVETGVGGGAPGSPAPYVAIGTMYFNTAEEFGAAFGPNVEKIMGDLPNFTNIAPVIQISEVML